MTRSFATFFAFLLIVSFSAAYAETYTWTDDQGTVHYTENLGTVPQNFRKNVRSVEESELSPVNKPASPEPPPATTRVFPASGMGKSGSAELYAGKTYDQWGKELKDREAAMITVRNRIDEIAVMLKSIADNWDEQKKLLTEYKSLADRLKDMKARYYEQVEIARKAGLQINIQQ